MRLSLGLVGLAVASFAAAGAPPSTPPRLNHDQNDYYVLHLAEGTSPEDVAQRLGLAHEGQLGPLDDHHIFSGPKVEHDPVDIEIKERKRRKRTLGSTDVLDSVRFAQKQIPSKRLVKREIPPKPLHFRQPLIERADPPPDTMKVQLQDNVMNTLGIKDPIFREQWHLINTLFPGHDVNVTGAWLQGITGKNATVAMVDDGLDMYSDDLKDNYYAQGSWDFNDPGPEPKPKLSDDRHGTRCAGEISAVKNDVCGIGVAYDSKVSGLRILSKQISDADESLALVYDFHHNDIYSCSWGPPDDGRSMDAPGILIRRAMLKAIQEGRNGLGSIYVFASGNGALVDDNCNFDGYTNSIYSITVGAIDRMGGHPYYSEKCSALLVVTYSSGNGDAIHTTDVGRNSCYNGHGGTSAAAPLAAGIFALILEIRQDLTWREMQWLIMMTAVPPNNDEGEWQTTTIGRKFSHTFGYGRVDAYGLVEAAKTWKNIKPQAWFYSPWIHVNQAIPEGDSGLKSTFEVTAEDLKKANLERIEHVTVTMNINHTRRGDVSVDLISPDGIVSHIATTRQNDMSRAGFQDWTFMSVVHWGESGVGTWTVIVKDSVRNTATGTFIDWHLKLWGESIDASRAVPLPMPNEEDDDDHLLIPTITASAVTTSVAHAPATGLPATKPADHPERPTKIQASSVTGGAGTPTETGPATGTQVAQETTSSSSWISWLPSFGASKTAQVWIYGAISLIAVFCLVLGVYLWMARRRRLRNNPRDDYEFELLHEDETQGLNSGEKGGAAGKRRTRGGELYDAFAGGSDDEDDFDDGGYRDRVGGQESPQHVVGDDDEEEDESEDEKGRGPLMGGR